MGRNKRSLRAVVSMLVFISAGCVNDEVESIAQGISDEATGMDE